MKPKFSPPANYCSPGPSTKQSATWLPVSRRQALQILSVLHRRTSATSESRSLKALAERMGSALHAQSRGQFTEALSCWDSARALDSQMEILTVRRTQCEEMARQASSLRKDLHRALAVEQWEDVLEVSEQLLALAPRSEEARKSRQQAWARAGLTHVLSPRPQSAPRLKESTFLGNRSPEGDTVTNREAGKRYLLWADAVGGFLVCLGDEIVLGLPLGGARVDVPIQGDLSRRHAVIRRDGEGYVLDPVRTVYLDDKQLSGPTALADGQRIRLGSTVELRFRLPHALSNSARLEWVSSHRTQPAVDGILLMAESCILGPAMHNHIVCDTWQEELVLFRKGEKLMARGRGLTQVDDQPVEGAVELGDESQLEGEDFSLRLEVFER